MQWIYPFYTITPMSMENFYYIVFTMYTVFCSGIYLCNLICYFRGLKISDKKGYANCFLAQNRHLNLHFYNFFDFLVLNYLIFQNLALSLQAI